VSRRRTALLAGLVVLGALLVVVVRAPERRAPPARGHRVFRVAERAVRAVDVRLDTRRFTAVRTGDGWTLDGRPAAPVAVAALDDLVRTLARLRAVDVFRPRDRASFGLDAPQASITLRTPRAARHVVLGDTNAAGSAVYARRDGDPRILQVGVMLLSSLERVFWARSAADQVPETG
jgi:hypothetical protein